jgi:hypothetical protein
MPDATPQLDPEELGERLQWNLEAALEALGHDEGRGDWWRVTADCGDEGWGLKGVIDDRDVAFDVTADGYQLDTDSETPQPAVKVESQAPAEAAS